MSLLLLRRCCRLLVVAVGRVGVLLVVEEFPFIRGEGERVRVKKRRAGEGEAAAC